MTDKDQARFPKADIWTNRTVALLKFIEQEELIVRKVVFPEVKKVKKADQAKFVQTFPVDLAELKKLKDGLEKDVYPGDMFMWYPLASAYELRQIKNCQRLLKRLRQFTANAAVFLQPSYDHMEGHSPRHLWRVLLNEASTDLRIFQAAVQQRTPGTYDQPEENGSPKNAIPDEKASSQLTLMMADIISEHALGQAVDSGFLHQTPVITYLKENISIRPVPYADVVLISIAYASMQPVFGKRNDDGVAYLKISRDMLAIPHEVGHHIFWKGKIPGEKESVRNHLQEQLKLAKIWEWDWRRAWLEEIFADAYGCLVAGPVMALAFQEMLTDNPPALFREDTGHHPIPALRPYIQSRILSKITDAYGNPFYSWVPKQLDEQWEKWLAANFSQEWASADPLQVEYKLHGLAHPLRGWRILEALEEVIKIVLSTLRAKPPTHAGAKWTHGEWKPWTSDVQEGEALVGLYDNLSINNFPLKGGWFQSRGDTGQASETQNWPEQIRFGWSEEGPERDDGG